jgi:transmembrane sensor
MRWYVCMQSGEVSPSEAAAFERWRAEPAHAAAYAELDCVWAVMRPAPGEHSRRVIARRGWAARAKYVRDHGVAIAASLLVVLGLGYQYERVWRHTAVVQGTEVVSRQLPDGSRLMLAPGTAIDVDYSSDRERRIRLARGEVYFDVAHDEARPFLIDAGATQVRVLGTAFSVKREGSEGAVVVERGRVRVSTDPMAVDLSPGEAIRFGVDREEVVAKVDARKALAWTQGRLIFEGRPLGEVLAALDPYYPGIIYLADRKAARRPIYAAIDLQHIDAWLDTLQHTQQLRARRFPGLTILN